MASLESLPADQRAVLQLVLQRGRGYDEIAKLLSIDRAGVRERALAAFDELGPQTGVPAQRRALITDYLLGQLPERVTGQTRQRLGQSASERAWARVVASELAPIASQPLPEIPVDADEDELEDEPEGQTEPVGAAAGTADRWAKFDEPASDGEPALDEGSAFGRGRGRALGEEPERETATAGAPGEPERPSSRRGGAMLLGLAGLLVVLLLVILIAGGGGSSKKTKPSAAKTPTTASTPTTTTGAQLIAQVNLISPAGGKKTAGVAQIIRQSANLGLVIVAQGVAPNTAHDAYAVWLYNTPADSHILGFVNPGVKSDGKLQTAGVLPANASHYKQLLVTLETQAKPHGPGKIVLEGALNLG